MLLDEVYKQIGEFGVYQSVLYVVLCLTAIPTGCQNMNVVFTMAEMDHFCAVPQLKNFSYAQQKFIAIPMDKNNQSYSQCDVFDLAWDTFTEADFANWTRPDVPTLKCASWVFDQSVFLSTLLSSMGLVCGAASQASIIQSVYMTGFLTGCVVFGQISDSFGRKKSILAGLVVTGTSVISSVFVNNFAAYTVLRFFVALGQAGAYTTVFVLCMELIGGKYRTPMGILVQCWFAFGIVILSGMSYFVRDHVKLQLILAIIPFFLLSYVVIIPESPRWLVSKGRDEEAIAVLRHIADINNKPLPKDLDLSDNRPKDMDPNAPKPTLLDLLKTPNLRKLTLTMWMIWFSSSMVYYGLSLGLSFLGGSLFVNSILSGALEIPFIASTILVIERFGRKLPTIIYMVLSGVCCLICIPFLQTQVSQAALSVFLLLGKSIMSGTFAIIYIYAAEIFPTVVRNVGVGGSSMSARVAGLVQPQVQLLSGVWSSLPFLLYGVLAMAGGSVTLLLPETLGQTLPDTMEEGENFGKKKSAVEPMEVNKSLEVISMESGAAHSNDHGNGIGNGHSNGHVNEALEED